MIELKVTVPDEASDPARYLEDALVALGFVRSTIYSRSAEKVARGEASVNDVRRLGAVSELAAGYGGLNDALSTLTEQGEAIQQELDAPKRKRGEPSPGKSRRTKAEIAEDEAAEQTGEAASEALPSAVDSPETDAQDEADEAAEQAERLGDRTTPTLDDVRKALGKVSKQHGIAVAAKLPGYFGGELAALEESRYPEIISEMEGMLQVDTATLKDMLESSEEGSDAFGGAQAPAEKPPNRNDLLSAMLRYGEYADGIGELEKMGQAKNTQADLPKIFEAEFGAGVTMQKHIKDDQLARAISVIHEAIHSDRFKRKR